MGKGSFPVSCDPWAVDFKTVTGEIAVAETGALWNHLFQDTLMFMTLKGASLLKLQHKQGK